MGTISPEQMQDGEMQAQEVEITKNLASCSCLDQMPNRRGKISRLDGRGVAGEISVLDRTEENGNA